MAESRLKQEADSWKKAFAEKHLDEDGTPVWEWADPDAIAMDAYLAGIRCGIELAAERCHEVTDEHSLVEDVAAVRHGYAQRPGEWLSEKCASSIRALLEAEAPKEGG